MPKLEEGLSLAREAEGRLLQAAQTEGFGAPSGLWTGPKMAPCGGEVDSASWAL